VWLTTATEAVGKLRNAESKMWNRKCGMTLIGRGDKPRGWSSSTRPIRVHVSTMSRNTAPAAHCAKYRSWVLVKCVWCGVYYWFRLRKGTGYSFHAFLTCILLPLLLIQCKISLYLGPVRMVRPVRCFVTVQSRFAETRFAETRFAETPTLTLTLNPNP